MVSIASYSEEQEPLNKESLAFCPSGLTEAACSRWLTAISGYLQNKLDKNSGDPEAFKKLMKSGEFIDALMASPFITSKLDKIPIDLTLKVIDVKDADSVLALEFDYDKEISRTDYGKTASRIKSYKFNFNLSGTATQNDEENPRNFIETSVSFSFQNMPSFDEATALSSINKYYTCTSAEMMEDPACARLIYDGTIKPFSMVGPTYYFDYGFDLGYETDQSFDASNTRFGGYLLTTYEDMSKDSFMGLNGIVPSLRIAVDSVEPSSSAPRAIAGDNSSYERLATEFHLSVPLVSLMDLPYLFSFNFRAYDELGAKEIIKTAKLDSYRLRTYSLSSPSGLVLSYSSGRLPFGLENEQTIELGFKSYF
jgi:hypothetical protein